jgi:glycosyltransferase involved in cell wall biosynthesis
MINSLIVFDSHPVQYRVPVWKSIEKIKPGALHVVYASDCSVKGHEDSGFGRIINWDEPMLEGYHNTILNCEKGKPLSGWSSLTGKGISEILDKVKPEYVLLTGLNYRYDWVALWQSKKRKIPTFLRCETQDEASSRSKLKSKIRFISYFSIYKWIDKFLYIGKLNKEHYLTHGVSSNKLFPATYATTDRFKKIDLETKNKMRIDCRTKSSINESKFVIGFSGKLIPKKNPEILYESLEYLPKDLKKNICFYFLGSGELDENLKQRAISAEKEFGIKTVFTGFVNQTEMPSHYLAMDIMVLPSRKMGETWGLVANEAMQAGCGVIVSDVVGCHKDFFNWERFRVFDEGNTIELAKCVEELSKFKRDFSWAQDGLKEYSIDNIAESIIRLI